MRECARCWLSNHFSLPFSLHKKGKPNTFASVDECYPMLLLLSLLSLTPDSPALCSTLKWLRLLIYPDIAIIAFKMKFYTALLLTALAGHSAKVYGSDAVDVSPDDVAITADSKGVLLAGYTNEGGDRGMTPASCHVSFVC